MIGKIALIFLVASLSFGAVPYDHEGFAVLPFDDGVIQGRALFNSSVASSSSSVVVRVEIQLPSGGEGYLVMDVRLAAAGSVAPTRWTYYEKVGPNTVSFDAASTEGNVVVVDRYETSNETSLRLRFDATFRDGDEQRRIEEGVIVTSPSPEVLRGQGKLPSGIVVVDDGSGTFVTGPDYFYNRGDLHCSGAAEEVVVLEDYDEPSYDYVVVDDGTVPPDDRSPIYGDNNDPEETAIYSDDEDYYDDDNEAYTDYELVSDDGNSGCGGSPDSEADDDSESEDSDDDDSGCVGDAEAAPKHRRIMRAPIRRTTTYLLARRVISVSPMLLLLAFLLIIRERRN